MNLSVQIGKLTLQNPVMVASGTFGYGVEYAQLLDLNQLGAVVVKGIRLGPVRGNPTPRTAAIEDRHSITLRMAGASADGQASGPGCSASRYSRINWIMPMTFSVCCSAIATLSCCCSATSSIESSSESSSEHRKLVSGWLNECSSSPSTSGPRGNFGNECGLVLMPMPRRDTSDIPHRGPCGLNMA